MWYDFVKQQKSLKGLTPAMAASVSNTLVGRRHRGFDRAQQSIGGRNAFGRVSAFMTHFEDEVTWLRFRLRRLRAILRILSDPKADQALAIAAVKEMISEAEERLDKLERM
jgi:hypothetical protein